MLRKGDIFILFNGLLMSKILNIPFLRFILKLQKEGALALHLRVVKWAKEFLGGNISEYFEEMARFAAEEDHLDIIKWIYENGLIQLQKIYHLALDNGHLHISEWTKKIRYVGSVNDNEESIEDNSEDQ
jgi:hypothetical protein